jgi:chondroitin AC lyase
MKHKGYWHLNFLPALAIVFLLLTESAFTQVTTSKQAIQTSSPDLEIIRKRIIADLMEPTVDAEEIARLIKTIKADGSWPDINYVDTSRTGFQHRQHLENMLALSRAYKKPGTEFYQDPATKRTVSSALDFWLKHDFICQNWWWNEMGTPNWMINTLLVLDEDLTEKQRIEGARIASRANLKASGARPGGDLIQIAGMLGKQGLFKRDELIIDTVVKVMASEIKTTTERGLQPDMSFHHRVDNVISTLSYGTGYASSFSYWAVKIAGTKYKFPDHAIKLLIDYYLDGISKSMAFGMYPDIGAKNRDLSRKAALTAAGTEIPENLLKTSDYRKKELEDIVQIRKGEKQPDQSWSRFFWHSEYFTYQRPRWFSSVRMHSNRQNNMEQPHNEEGLKNHHFGDGSNFITITGKEYFDIFPVWDWQKIPGTTIIQKPEFPHWRELAKKGLSDFVGGVTDGQYGAAAFDFQSPHDALKARKAWFFFDREFVCLGTGITSDANNPVVTTINQSLLNKDVVVLSENKRTSLDRGNHQVKNVSWILHDSIGYIFRSAGTVHVKNDTATGNWRQINHQEWATEEPVQKAVFTLWVDHGIKPQNSGYEYIVIPATNASALDQYDKSSDIIILSNSSLVQAVQHRGIGRTYIVFYQDGLIKLSGGLVISAQSPCMVMIKTNGTTIQTMTVSDPSRKLKSLQLSVNARIAGTGNKWRSKWNKAKKVSVIDIELPAEGFAGQSVVLELKK